MGEVAEAVSETVEETPGFILESYEVCMKWAKIIVLTVVAVLLMLIVCAFHSYYTSVKAIFRIRSSQAEAA
ncbi:unnamed protein product [Allacma fusca]|uniref:Uncharacterized protein n=1 Tax=Allacma fusca TaxID=39272 RepID=A0A8J2P622_9HEXA|nr:unnamed protein product [Allacma fusca]